MPKLLFEYASMFRITGLAGLSIGPVFGALSLVSTDITVDIKTAGLLLLIGIFATIYGFIVNDIVDIEVDKLSKEPEKRPLVKGTISKATAIFMCAFFGIGGFVITFIFFYRNSPAFFMGVLCLALAYILIFIYNVWGKKIIALDFFVALAEAFGVLFGALMISSTGSVNIFTWVIFILVFNQYLFGNAIVNGIKDADHDYLKDTRNIALASGVKVSKDRKIFIPWSFKTFGIGIRFFSGFIVFIPFLFFNEPYELWYMAFLILIVAVLMIMSIKLLNIKTFDSTDQKTVRFFGMQGVIRYALVPIILMPIIGIPYGFILIIFPILWYIIFTPFTGKKLFKHIM